MFDDLVLKLEKASALHRSSPLRKLFSLPGKLAYTRWILRSGNRAVRKSVNTFWGEPMTVVLPETVSNTIYTYGFLEFDLTRAFIQYLKPGMTFFDVGAHFGYFTCLASHLVGPSGVVHSFEPTRSTFEILLENTKSRANVRTNNVAAFSESKTISFNDFGLEHAAFNSVAAARVDKDARKTLKSQTYDVKAITLDEYSREIGAKPDVIKIDAESAEYQILQGMDRILTEVKPAVSIEVGDYNLDGVATSSQTVKFLMDKGYSPFEWRDGALRPHDVQLKYAYANLLFLNERKRA